MEASIDRFGRIVIPKQIRERLKRFFVRIEPVEIQPGDFGGTSAGVVEQIKDGVIAEAFLFSQLHAIEDLHHILVL